MPNQSSLCFSMDIDCKPRQSLLLLRSSCHQWVSGLAIGHCLVCRMKSVLFGVDEAKADRSFCDSYCPRQMKD